MKRVLYTAAVLTALSAATAFAEMRVTLKGAWDGKRIPAGQHCVLFGGNGSTPPMHIANLPKGTAMVVAQYNDRDYQPLSRKGGHGTIGYAVSGVNADLPAVPGMTDRNLPRGVRVVQKARSSGRYKSDGYLPPCSGGKGNRYTVDLKAVNASGKVLETVRRIPIGRY